MKPTDLGERLLRRDVVALLRDLATRIESGRVPGWALRNISLPLQMVRSVVHGVEENRRRFAAHDCQRERCVTEQP